MENETVNTRSRASWTAKLFCIGGMLYTLGGMLFLLSSHHKSLDLGTVENLRYRRLGQPELFTAAPSVVQQHYGEHEYDSQSNDNQSNDSESIINKTIKDEEQFNKTAYTGDSDKTLGIIAVAIAAFFAVAMMAYMAVGLSKQSRRRSTAELARQSKEPVTTSDDNDGAFPCTVDSKPIHSDHGGSILRIRGSEPVDCNPGRRVRFQLPGSETSNGDASISSDECGEDFLVVPIDEEKGIQEEPPMKSVRITVEDLDNVDPKKATGHSYPGDADTAEKKPKMLMKTDDHTAAQTDQEAWVMRIMHPWLNNSICCPENWEDCDCCVRRSKAPALSQDQATVATNSFESITSSQSNEVTSVTPIMPPFPTSTYDSQYDTDNDGDLAKADIDDVGDDLGTVTETGAVLGIMDRNAAILDDDSAAQVDDNKRKRRRELASSSASPARDSWYDGEDHIVSPPKPLPKKAAWRKKAWTTSPQTEDIDAGPLDEEFDIESYSEDYSYRPSGRWPGRLAEI